jgi:hypothetical protein
MVGGFFGFILFLQILFCIFVFSMTRQFTRVTVAVVSTKTFKMQRKFSRVFFIRLILMITFCFVPNVLLNMRAYWTFNVILYQLIVNGLMGLHCPFQASLFLIEIPIIKRVANQVRDTLSWTK